MGTISRALAICKPEPEDYHEQYTSQYLHFTCDFAFVPYGFALCNTNPGGKKAIIPGQIYV
jgi:hypothetical protein